jgi:hypothetical protein
VPDVLGQLSEALAVPDVEFIRLSGYRVPGEPDQNAAEARYSHPSWVRT